MINLLESFKMKLKTLWTVESYCFLLSIFIGKNFPAFQENWKFSMESYPSYTDYRYQNLFKISVSEWGFWDSPCSSLTENYV